MSNSKPVGTPVDPGSHLTENEEALEQQLYQSIVGSSIIILSTTLQDSPARPTEAHMHWTAANRVLRECTC